VLSDTLAAVEKELSVLSGATSITVDALKIFCFTSKSGERIYSPAICKLYYSLLSDQIPPSKICKTIKAVLKINVFCQIWILNIYSCLKSGVLATCVEKNLQL